MNEHDDILRQLRAQVQAGDIRLSLHGHEEMVAEEILYEDICEVLCQGKVLENYPDYQRGPCCLICGQTSGGRFLHVVCTTSLEVAIIITTYLPKLPKWVTPFQRRPK